MTDRIKLSAKERTRLFLLHGGICHICGGKIDGAREAWDISHVYALALIGRAAETDENRKPAHRKCHRTRTAEEDAPAIAKAKRQERKFKLGIRGGSGRGFPCSRNSPYRKKIDGSVVRREP